ncbi:heterokaryon incompatibility protein-domain-containing protein [Kalaharituber pfeilii]|nr:heterokaryon incompatibility protein-domain-containing protein [Kalaharituber pfeilii]
MRLIDTTTLKVKLFDKDIPPYAILTHTWDSHEINLQQFTGDHSKLTPEEQAGGLRKIQEFCARALADGFQYGWVDTCCIDKTNSTELSEALNSMYDWYGDATVCYAYLADVPEDEDPLAPNSAFRQARWFTRGWTLQELLAPLTVVFYGKNWIEIGTKASLMKAVSEVTGIASGVLLVSYSRTVSVGERLSWAAGRKTTKVEDLAYSLLGLLQVKMPVLYGEGTHAFVRLQQELIKTSDDQTIFAWTGQPGSGGVSNQGVPWGRARVIQSCPAQFEYCIAARPSSSPF